MIDWVINNTADLPIINSEMDMEGPINALSASPDGNLIIAAGRDGKRKNHILHFISISYTSIHF